MSPVLGKSLLLYITALDASLGALLTQHNDEGKEHALYYLIRTMVGAKLNYSSIEKICLALIFTIQKMCHYLLITTVHLISKADPLKYIMSHLFVQGRFAKWTILLSEFDIHYCNTPQCLRRVKM